MFLQKGAEEVNLSSVQMAVGNSVQQGGTLGMHGQVVSAGPLQNSIQQQHAVQPLSQQQTLLREKNTALAKVRETTFHAAADTVYSELSRVSNHLLWICASGCFSVSALISRTAASTKSSCFSLQHHDDPAAKRHQCCADRHQPGPEPWTQHPHRGYVCTGPRSSD